MFWLPRSIRSVVLKFKLPISRTTSKAMCASDSIRVNIGPFQEHSSSLYTGKVFYSGLFSGKILSLWVSNTVEAQFRTRLVGTNCVPDPGFHT